MKKTLLLALAVLVAACCFSTVAAAEPKGTLRVAISTMPNSLYVPVAAERQALTTAWHLYNSLTWLDDEGKVTPALAESWTISEDGSQFTSKLRSGQPRWKISPTSRNCARPATWFHWWALFRWSPGT